MIIVGGQSTRAVEAEHGSTEKGATGEVGGGGDWPNMGERPARGELGLCERMV